MCVRPQPKDASVQTDRYEMLRAADRREAAC